jgi:hypothetical protein
MITEKKVLKMEVHLIEGFSMVLARLKINLEKQNLN